MVARLDKPKSIPIKAFSFNLTLFLNSLSRTNSILYTLPIGIILTSFSFELETSMPTSRVNLVLGKVNLPFFILQL